MSTILKALRRSEADRREGPRLGTVPGDGAMPRGHRRDLVWILVVVLAFSTAAIAAWLFSGDAAPRDSEERRSRVAQVSLPPAPEKEEEALPADRGTESGPSGESRSASTPASGDPAGSRQAEKESAPQTADRDTARSRPSPGETQPRSGPESEPDGEADGQIAKATPEPARRLQEYALLPRLRDLPGPRRESLPDLTLNAHVYAENPLDRFVLINLTRFREGDHVAPGVRVAAIFAGGVVLEDGSGRFVLPRP